MSKPRILAALTAVAVMAGGTGTALAQSTEGDTTVTVGPRVVLSAGDTAPFDAPGVRQIRRGQDIPNGYTVIGRSLSGGSGSVGAAIKFTCPDGERLRTFATTGRVGFSAISRNYAGHRSTTVLGFGGHGDGTIYAVCR